MRGRKKPEAAEGAASADAKVDSRGQITVQLDGLDYVLRPSRKAIAAIERQTRPLYHLARAAEELALSIDEQAICIVEMMKAYGEANPEDERATDYKGARAERVADLLFETSPFAIQGRLWIVLNGALYGGYTASGEVKAAKTATTA